MTPMMKGRQAAALDREYAGGWTFRKWIEGGDVGGAEIKAVPKAVYNRRRFNRMDAAEQTAYEKRLAETKKEYRLFNKNDMDTFKRVPKLVYAYYMEWASERKEQDNPFEKMDVPCTVCGEKPTVRASGLCGPCTWGEADTINGNW